MCLTVNVHSGRGILHQVNSFAFWIYTIKGGGAKKFGGSKVLAYCIRSKGFRLSVPFLAVSFVESQLIYPERWERVNTSSDTHTRLTQLNYTGCTQVQWKYRANTNTRTLIVGYIIYTQDN